MNFGDIFFVMGLCACSLVVACSVSQAELPAVPESNRNECQEGEPAPKGKSVEFQPSKLSLPSEIVVAEPTSCPTNASYISVTSTLDKRTIVMGRKSGSITGCTELSKREGECETINVHALLTEVHKQLVHQGIEPGAIGKGPCGTSGELLDWQMSLKVYDWADANAAVQQLVDTLSEYEVGGTLGIAIEGPICGVLLEESLSK